MDWTELATRPPVWTEPSVGQPVTQEVGSEDAPLRVLSGDTSYPFIVLTRSLTFRNYADQLFLISASPKICETVTDISLQSFSQQSDPQPWHLSDCSKLTVQLFRERLLWPEPPSQLPGKKEYKYLLLRSDERAPIWINEVEHLTQIQVFAGAISESDFAASYQVPAETESPFSPHAPWAWSDSYGYLTSDPTRIGPGLSMEILVHLPGLALSHRLPQAQNAMTALGIAFQPVTRMTPGMFGAGGSDFDSNLFWLKSRGGLGQSAIEVYRNFLRTVKPLLDWEAKAQRQCLEKHQKRLEDRVHKSLHLLAQARVMPYSELMALGSFARMGAYLGILPVQIPLVLEELRITTKSGHLRVSAGRDLTKEEEDISRANVVRLTMERPSIRS